jgi:hypothetical protein
MFQSPKGNDPNNTLEDTSLISESSVHEGAAKITKLERTAEVPKEPITISNVVSQETATTDTIIPQDLSIIKVEDNLKENNTSLSSATLEAKDTTPIEPPKKRSKLDRSRKNYKTTPNSETNNDPFYCTLCGRNSFVTLAGAKRHQQECDGKPNPKGPWKCSICFKSEFLTSQAFGSHWRCCNKGNSVSMSTLSLTPMELKLQFEKLSDFNKLVVQSLECFEASPTDVQRQKLGNSRRQIDCGSIGIRCSFCACHNSLRIGSVSYPNTLATMPHCLYVMTQRHLLVNCPHATVSWRNQIATTKSTSTSQSMSFGSVGLPTYLKALQSFYDMVDSREHKGIRRHQQQQLEVST